jgi:hypothetical protein
MYGSAAPVYKTGDIVGGGCVHGITSAKRAGKAGKRLQKSAFDIAVFSLNSLIQTMMSRYLADPAIDTIMLICLLKSQPSLRVIRST